MTCAGITKKGLQCRKLPLKTSKYCHLHDGNDSDFEKLSLQDDTLVKAKSLEWTSNISHDLISPPIVKNLPVKLGIIDVLGDGYCFWRALSVCLENNEESYRKYIYKCMENKSVDESISYTWVEFHEVPVISRILKLNISIVHIQEGVPYVYFCKDNGEIETYKYITIDPKIGPCIYFTGNHYMSIVWSKNVKIEWETYISKFE